MFQDKITLFGFQFDNRSLVDAVNGIGILLISKNRHIVATPNVDQVVMAQTDPKLLTFYQNASMVFADGMPIIWASRLFGRPLKERVTGADLLPMLCMQAAERGHKVFFLGGEPGVGEQAAENLSRRFPKLQVVGCDAPPLGFEQDPKESQRIIRKVNAARPDLLFLAFGAPKQEFWISRHLNQLEIRAAVCAGAALDFEAGRSTRAPVWMQHSGLEWLWRLGSEPRRLWKRYLLRDIRFFVICLKEWKKLSAKRQETTG